MAHSHAYIHSHTHNIQDDIMTKYAKGKTIGYSSWRAWPANV